MYGGTGGPNDEDYSKDRLVNEDAYNVTRPTEQNLGEHVRLISLRINEKTFKSFI
jgi:hypothetical protein